MATTLKVKKVGKNQIETSWKPNHPKSDQIDSWLQHLSPGYVEYLLQFGNDPHCNACRDGGCEMQGTGNDACTGFKFGARW